MREFKRILAAFSLCAMAMSLVACGDDEKETTTEEVTTEEVTDEDATGDVSVDLDENGKLTMLGMSIVIPEGYEYSEDDSSESAVTFVNYTTAGALVIGVDNQNTYFDDSNVVEIFDDQIKVPYGDDVTYSSVTYNGHQATEWVLDNEEGGYVGRSLVICDGSMLIYIEYISYEGDLAPYEDAVNTIEY